MMKHRIKILIILCCFFPESGLLGQQKNSSVATEKLPAGAYISLNPVSLPAFIPSTFTKEVLPFAHNLESGISFAGGYYFSRLQLEGRLVLGSPSALIFCPQIHTGLRYFPLSKKNGEILPLGFGLFIRAFDTYYTHSGIHFMNFSPQPQIGYVIRVNHFFYDFRIGWDVLVCTFSNLKYSSPRIAFSHFPPAVSINIGYVF
jgi:hypothetical protein